jgi:hypothetical protein
MNFEKKIKLKKSSSVEDKRLNVVFYFFAGSHLHLTGETIAPSFFNSANTLSTIFLSSPVISTTFHAFTGSPAFFIAANTISFSFIFLENKIKLISLVYKKTEKFQEILDT